MNTGSRVFNQVAYKFCHNILGGINTFNLCFNVRTFMQSFKRTFKKSAYIRMQIKFPHTQGLLVMALYLEHFANSLDKSGHQNELLQ